MSRLDWIDIARGSFFFPMLLYHFFSLYDVTVGTTLASNPMIHLLGNVRLLYILLAGVSLYLSATRSRSASGFYKKRVRRTYDIAVYAACLTLVTYWLHPTQMIRFGILHFIALGTLLVSPIAYANSIPLTMVALMASCCLSYLPSFSKSIDVVLGGSIPYNSMDWFPLNRYLPVLLLGLLIAQVTNLNQVEQDTQTPYRQLEWMGTHSLELYAAHVIVLMIVYYVLFHKNDK